MTMKTMSPWLLIGSLSLMFGAFAWADDVTNSTSGAESAPAASPVVAKPHHSKKTSGRLFCVEGERRTKSGCEPDLGRGLASVPTGRQIHLGQGEQMLNDVRSNQPRFMGEANANDSAVRLTGVCHDVDGVVYYSGQKGYSDCLDSRTTSTGNVSDYFSAYRQAGVGIQIGK